MGTFKRLGTIGAAALAASAILLPLTASAAPAGHTTPKPTIVLVHGAFAESASWNGVISRLQRQGYPVVAVANPLRSLDGDIKYLKQVLAGIHGPIVLAGHSYGGMLISGAAAGNPQVKALAYIAAFAPEAGESALGLSTKFPGSTLGDTLSKNPLGDGTNDLTIQQDKFAAQFAQVAVDTVTGRVRVERVVSVHDIGRIVNPMTAESQVYGGDIQGIGFATMERQVRDGPTGRVLNANLEEYKVPTALDVPEIIVRFVDEAPGPVRSLFC